MLTAIFQLRNVAALKSWKTTRGKIIERGTFRITHATRSTPAFQHSPLVKYIYQVDGQEFTNDAVAPRHVRLPAHNTVEWAENEAAKFPDEPTVYYNPENPADSFLVPTSSTTLYIMLGAFFLVSLLSLIFLIL